MSRKNYYEANKETIREGHRAWLLAHPDYSKTYARDYYKANSEQIKADATQYRRDHPGLVAKSRAKKRGIDFLLTEEQYDGVMALSHCQCCGAELSSASRDTSKTMDRVDNRVGYVLGNVACVCGRCNREKGAHTVESLRKLADWIETWLKP